MSGYGCCVYWDPLPVVAASDYGDLGPPEKYLCGQWSERDWRNVPGPFYCAGTDNCLTGFVAPGSVAFEDGYGSEFVYRQPRDEREVHLLLEAAWQDVFSAYACDGDDHWTLPLVREWWAERGRLLAWISTVEALWSEKDWDFLFPVLAYRTFITGGLETYLREYGFWLEHRRPRSRGEALPRISLAHTEFS